MNLPLPYDFDPSHLSFCSDMTINDNFSSISVLLSPIQSDSVPSPQSTTQSISDESSPLIAVLGQVLLPDTVISPSLPLVESSSSVPSTTNPTQHMSLLETTSTAEDSDQTNSEKDGRAQYPCLHKGCDRVLTSMYTRKVHMSTHKPKPRKSFKCTMGCDVYFTRQHDRNRHEVTLHGKKCNYVCPRCSRFFSGQKKLDNHTCHGQREGSFRWPLAES
jgi:hypothetical protein